MKAVTSTAVKCRRGAITKAGVESRCPYWRPTVNLIRCEALNCTICRLQDDMIVVARQTIVEFHISGRLSNQNVVEVYND